MRCERIQHLYDDYSRGNLPVATMARVEDHLAGCPACRQEFELNDRIALALRQGDEVAHPGGEYFEALTASILDRLENPEANAGLIAPPPASGAQAIWRQPLWWMGGLSAAALLSLGIFAPAMRDNSRMLAAVPSPVSLSASAPTPLAVPSSAGPSVVVSDTRRELVFGPGMEWAPGGAGLRSGTASAFPSALGVPRSNPTLDMLAGLYGTMPPTTSAPGLPQAVATPRPEMREVAMKPAAEPASALPSELAEQFEAIRKELLAQGDENLYPKLRDLSAQIGVRPNRDALEAQPLVRQIGLFIKAQDDLAAGHAQDAGINYKRILLIDEKSPLAVRASLQLADLYHNEWADFKEAQAYYAKCTGKAGEAALAPTERDHVTRQLERLRAHAADNWQALGLLHQVQRGEWIEVQSALGRLVALDGSGDLLPEAARTIVDRVQAGPAAPADIAVGVYKLLETRAATEENGSVRAWLEMALGDLQWVQFQQLQGAMSHYNQAISIGGDSGAARLAATRRDQLINRQLIDSVR